MTEQDEELRGEPDRDMLLYDFFKHLTSLSLLTLGGLLIVMKDFDPEDVKPFMVTIDLILVSAGGIAAFSGSSEIVRSRYLGIAPKRSLQYLRVAAPALLAFGVGIFLAMFVDSLS